MKVILASPNFHQPRGNTVTVQRIADGLNKLGVQTEIISTTDEKSLTNFPTGDIVHGFHAYKFYTFMKKLSKKPDPYIISLTGTDLNHDLFDHSKREDVLASLKGAKAIHVFDEEAKETLIKEAPEISDKVYCIAQGHSDFPSENISANKAENTFLFVLPAGIRKVKNVPSSIEMLKPLHDKYPHVRLLLVGPIIEEDEGKVVKELVQKHQDWVEYAGQFPHSEMGSIYQKADVVLNTSHSEGQSIALLEGMSYGIPVIVSNNPGNRTTVTHGQTGFLYNTEDEFLEFAEQLLNNNKIKHKMGQLAKKYIDKHHSRTYEAEKMFEIYSNIMKM